MDKAGAKRYRDESSLLESRRRSKAGCASSDFKGAVVDASVSARSLL